MKPVLYIPALATLLILFASASIAAQSNDRIDELLLEAPARIDSAAYIVLAAGGLIKESDTPDTAFQKIKSMKLVDPNTAPDTPVRVEDLSYLLMAALDLHGGLFYSLFPGPRYAYREMVYTKTVLDTGGPLRKVNGDEVMRSLGYALTLKGAAK